MRYLIALSMLTAWSAQATTVPTLDFFNTVEGKYRILLANGAVPHQIPDPRNPGVKKDVLASVDISQEEVLLTFPYCTEAKGCDVGYIFLPLDPKDAVEVTRDEHADKTVVHKIRLTEGGLNSYYEWETSPAKSTILFRRLNYQIENDPPFDLVFEVEKAKN